MATLYSNADVADKNLDAELDTHTFTRTSVTTITLTPDGIDGKSRVAVSDGTSVTIVTLSSALTCNLTVAGAGGLDTGSEATSTGYECRLITKAAGADPVLLFTAASGSTTNATATLPATYTLQSKIIFFVHNNASSDIVGFFHRGRQVDYTGSDSISGAGLVWLSGTNTAYNERDLTQYLPVNAGSWVSRQARAWFGTMITFSYTDDASGYSACASVCGLGSSSEKIYTAPGDILAVPTTNYGVGIWTLGGNSSGYGFQIHGYTL
ncbi:MAG TPA: hypothetical protein EYN66_04365 [Myxococcales bacterium]|nr:hypothetical protein [Myxococcales bacterium]